MSLRVLGSKGTWKFGRNDRPCLKPQSYVHNPMMQRLINLGLKQCSNAHRLDRFTPSDETPEINNEINNDIQIEIQT